MSAILGHFYEISLVYICIAVGDPVTKRIPLINLTLPHACACPMPGCATSYVMVVFFMFIEWMWEVIVHFVDIKREFEDYRNKPN